MPHNDPLCTDHIDKDIFYEGIRISVGEILVETNADEYLYSYFPNKRFFVVRDVYHFQPAFGCKYPHGMRVKSYGYGCTADLFCFINYLAEYFLMTEVYPVKIAYGDHRVFKCKRFGQISN